MISGLDVFRPGTGWLVPLEDRLTLMAGDVLRVSVAVPYRGPAYEFTRYGSIGQRGFFGFDEILSARATLSCPDSPEKYTTVTGELDIEIIGAGMAGIGGISGGNDYDLYAKIGGTIAKVISPTLLDVVEMLAETPQSQFGEISITGYVKV